MKTRMRKQEEAIARREQNIKHYMSGLGYVDTRKKTAAAAVTLQEKIQRAQSDISNTKKNMETYK